MTETALEPTEFWTNDDPRLHLLSWEGEGAPLLLTHGMAGNAHWWDLAGPSLAGSFRPVALDFHGHGDSEWRADAKYDTGCFVDDIENARHVLGWNRMVLAGHSLGARIALEYAARYPERLLGLIAIDFLPEFYESKARRFEKTRSRPQPFYKDSETMVRQFHLQPPGTLLKEDELRKFAFNCLKPADGRYTWKFDWKAFLYQYAPIWPTLPKIKAPTLIVRGENSTVLGREAFQRVLRELPGAQGVEVPGAHHHVPLDTPKELSAQMAGFLKKCLS